jgi:hypothetical protein
MAFEPGAGGKNYGNHEINRASRRSAGMHAPKPAPEPGQGGEEQPIEDVVNAHGPAEHLEIHSHHKDGHVHKSVHHHPDSAHHHVSAAMVEHEQHSEPDGDEGKSMGMAAIPPMQ